MDPVRSRLLASFLIVVVTAALSFALGARYGKITNQTPSGIEFSCDPSILSALAIPKGTGSVAGVQTASASKTTGAFFGSKNGTKYYGASCESGKKRIKPENLIWFESSAEAEIQGYTRSTSC